MVTKTCAHCKGFLGKYFMKRQTPYGFAYLYACKKCGRTTWISYITERKGIVDAYFLEMMR